MRLVLPLVLLCLAAGPIWSAPHAYELDRARSDVTFTWFLGDDAIAGNIPIETATMILDLEAVGRSDVRVSLGADAAQAGFIIATQALRGPDVFDTQNHPRITFQSEAFRVSGNQVQVDGRVTIRGVTRPMVMHATLHRQAGAVPDDADRLAVHLTGAINRHDFGASGFANQVGARVEISILAYIARTP
ncbi:MAG: YceI family protein [Pseudomonadota bacterium]